MPQLVSVEVEIKNPQEFLKLASLDLTGSVYARRRPIVEAVIMHFRIYYNLKFTFALVYYAEFQLSI